jgi:hypothetical protein
MGKNERLQRYFALLNKLTLSREKKEKPSGRFGFFKGSFKPNFFFSRKRNATRLHASSPKKSYRASTKSDQPEN